MYAADVSCQKTWESLAGSDKAALVDVRTRQEWERIGVPDLSQLGKSPLFVEWQRAPDMQINPQFAETVDGELRARGIGHDDPVYFICRSGARSKGAAAALTALGYRRAYNVEAGFEGDPDASGERANINGWQHDGLPFKGALAK